MAEVTAPVEVPKDPAISQDPKPTQEAPTPQPEAHVDPERLNKAIADIEKKNEALRKATDLQATLVTENPDLIHKIAASDPIMANQIVEKIWGDEGIRSYKQLTDRAKLETIKEKDPDLYETKTEIADLKNRLKQREETDHKNTRQYFLEKVGIKENEYDPNYRKFLDALESVNPTIVENDYGKALQLAHKLMVDSKEITVQAHPPSIQMGGGQSLAPFADPKPATSEQSQWLAESLNKARGYNISLN